MHSTISLSVIFKEKSTGLVNKLLIKIGDYLLGLNKLQKFYSNSNLPGLAAEPFCDELVRMQNRPLTNTQLLTEVVPNTGSLIVVCNHPHGCIEGVALAGALRKRRSDVKVLANKGLAMFQELHELFIFIDPLNPSDPSNLKGIRECKKHLNNGGVLLIFPAGKVSYYRPEKQRICDGEWNRLPGALARATDSPVLPIHISGHNSDFFITMGRIYYRFKLLMLFREMMHLKNKPLELSVGRILPTKLLAKCGDEAQITAFLRAQCYCLDPQFNATWSADSAQQFADLNAPVPGQVLASEINSLPNSQHLADYKKFRVSYASLHQAPNVVKDITRLREKVFRLYDEGSGESADGDEFDKTYLHLFIFDTEEQEIIGAYRMGQSDKLIPEFGLKGMYLSRMFKFSPEFINQQQPCLEMGRSFIVPEHQRSFYGLFLLWRGIGEFVVRHPQYRILYGTVSLSKLYRPLSVECISKLALNPCSNVSAKVPFAPVNNPELDDYIAETPDTGNLLSILVQGIEQDGKDVPILMKQYNKLAARFYCIGIDKNFNDTPGLLLSVDMSKAPHKALKQYLAEGLEQYLNYKKGS
ncbi:lysophospholipid acyltransferase family protein [Psychrosphaera sp. 1_MG-2023]|uniref:lysophospholipid acyltransferase family protein n=1 Tax=Psychrosphaera sp. 1_MG-2023 TaxID=3062643 RepID=UPI0026E1FF81|nr:lysophospholipid acyltransferase family protein [Psychrosphaera sp. 1_MG-2023]MDO6719486.1 lysophospholipid acyltransferase family protein [Psychrosphaera sp. 1_MG-2023]